MAIDFSEILNLQVGSAPKPKPLPAGTYIGRIEGLPQMRTYIDKKEGKERPVCDIKIALVEPGEDVDAEEIERSGGLRLGNGEPKTVRMTFFMEEESRFRLDNFLEGFGLDSGSYTDAFQALPGREVQASVKVNGEFNNIDRCFAVA